MTRSALCGHASCFKIEVAAGAEMISHPQGPWNKTAGREAQCLRMTNVPVEQMNQTALIQRLNFTRDWPQMPENYLQCGDVAQMLTANFLWVTEVFSRNYQRPLPCSEGITSHSTSQPCPLKAFWAALRWCSLGGDLHTTVHNIMHYGPSRV